MKNTLRKIAIELSNLGEHDLKDRVLCALSAVTGNEDPRPDLTYSSVMRDLRKDKDRCLAFQKKFKEAFDMALDNDIEEPDQVALMDAIQEVGYDG